MNLNYKIGKLKKHIIEKYMQQFLDALLELDK